MREYICDLCEKRIEPKDIHMEVQLRVDNKIEYADFHSICYYKLLRAIREEGNEK